MTTIKVMFLGDIVGQRALKAVCNYVRDSLTQNKVDLVIVNAENATEGFGLSRTDYEHLVNSGVRVVSGGNHIWDKKDIFQYIGSSCIARPCNLPQGVPGRGWQIVEVHGRKVAHINVLGRVFMSVTTLDCPLKSCDRVLDELKLHGVEAVFVDVHAEATSEKQALGHYLDGRVAGVFGTHTHVQTADETIMTGGTAYITDAGPCASINSIIGFRREPFLNKFLTGLPARPEIPNSPIKIHGVLVELDAAMRPKDIQRIAHLVYEH